MGLASMIGAMVGSALDVRGKPHRRAQRYLTGPSGRSFLDASTLMTAAGLAWGAYEVFRTRPGAGGSTTTVLPELPPRHAPPSTTTVVRDELPGALPPLPEVAGPASAALPTQAASPALPLGAQQLLRLTVAAAKADGTLGEEEYGRILATAHEHGVGEIVAKELAAPRPLAELVAGVRDPQHKADVYALAFGIVRADLDVTGPERIWLARLATHLGLDRATTDRIESETAARIARTPAASG
jgi:hypothetical protein